MTVAAHHARQCTCARARGQQNVRPCSNHANRTDSRYTANKRNGNICVITSRATRKCTVMHRAAHRARAHFQPGEHRSLGVRLVRIHARSIHPRSFAMRATTFYLQLEAILRTNHSMMMHCVRKMQFCGYRALSAERVHVHVIAERMLRMRANACDFPVPGTSTRTSAPHDNRVQRRNGRLYVSPSCSYKLPRRCSKSN